MLVTLHRELSAQNAQAKMLGRVEDNHLDITSLDDSGAPPTPSRPKAPTVPEILLECLSGETAEAVIEHRQAIKHPLKTATARHLPQRLQVRCRPGGCSLDDGLARLARV
jgi:hypothetical protein